MLHTISRLFLTLLVLVSFSINAYASLEDAELRRLLSELKSLERIIVIAEQSADSDSRLTFDYQQLRGDLLKIQQGIEDHINQVRRDPRKLPDISADY